MSIPIRGFKKDSEEGGAAEDWMQGQTLEETMERVSPPGCEVWPEAVAADVFHFVLVWEWGDGGCGVILAQYFIKEDEVGEAPADRAGGGLERFEIGLLSVLVEVAGFGAEPLAVHTAMKRGHTFVRTR